MAPGDARTEFTNRLRARGFELQRESIQIGFSEGFAFYRDVRPEGCERLDGDMLLFQWGTYDWGKGRYFNLDLTRQFILEDTADEQGIFQLAFTFLFVPSTAVESLKEGNRWCRCPEDLAHFQNYVTSSEAYRVALGCIPARVHLTYEAAG
jgi:hypothetical protein